MRMLTVTVTLSLSAMNIYPKHEQGTITSMAAVSSWRVKLYATVAGPQNVLLQEYGSVFRTCTTLP